MNLFLLLFGILSNSLLYYFFVVCYQKTENKKNTIKKRSILFIVLFSLLNTINNLYNISIFKLLIMYLLILFLIIFVFPKNKKKSIFYGTIFTMLLIILDLFSSILISPFIINIYELNNMLFYKILLSIIVISCMYLIIMNKNIINFLKKIENIIEKSTTKNIVFITSLFLIILLNIVSVIYGINYKNFYYYFVVVLSVIVLLLIIMFLLKNKYENIIMNNKNNYLENNNKYYENLFEEYRIIKHNFMNDLLIIENSCKMEENKNLIYEIMKKYNVPFNEEIVRSTDIPDSLKGLIYAKLLEAKSKKIKIIINYDKNFFVEQKKDVAYFYSLCETLAIVLDNAIKASSESKDKIIMIDFLTNNKECIISINNTYNNQIDLNKIGTKGYSTKKNKSGLGLYYINHKMKKRINIQQKIINNIFMVQIII